MRTHLIYFLGMAHLGLGQKAEARTAFSTVLAKERYHSGALEGLAEL